MKYIIFSLTLLASVAGSAQSSVTVTGRGAADNDVIVTGRPAKNRTVVVTGRKSDEFDSLPATTKELSFETPVSADLDILIENSSRNIEIRDWDKSSLKITTTISYKGSADLSDEEWFDKVKIQWKKFAGSFRLSVSGSDYNSFYNSSSNGTSYRAVKVLNIKQAPVIVYVPKSTRLEIESKYGSLTFGGKMNALKIVSSNTNIDLGEVNRLSIRSQFDNITAGNIKDAEVEISNGRFSAKTVDLLDIDSRFCSLDIETLTKATIRSQNDEYEIETAGNIQGRKSYGTLRVVNMTKGLDLEGTNADVKLRHIAPGAGNIKIDNKYADLRLPVDDLKNFSVKMVGIYNTVYAGFERTPITYNDSIARGKGKSYTTEYEYAYSNDIAAGVPAPPAPPAPAAAPNAPAPPKAPKTPQPGKTYTFEGTTTAEIDSVVVVDEINAGIGEVNRLNKTMNLDSRGRKLDGLTIVKSARGSDRNSSFTAKSGDGSGPKFQINCAYCTVDFK